MCWHKWEYYRRGESHSAMGRICKKCGLAQADVGWAEFEWVECKKDNTWIKDALWYIIKDYTD